MAGNSHVKPQQSSKSFLPGHWLAAFLEIHGHNIYLFFEFPLGTGSVRHDRICKSSGGRKI